VVVAERPSQGRREFAVQFISPIALIIVGLGLFVFTSLWLQRHPSARPPAGTPADAAPKTSGGRATLIMGSLLGALIFLYGLVRLILELVGLH
jgi:hypothetical protein